MSSWKSEIVISGKRQTKFIKHYSESQEPLISADQVNKFKEIFKKAIDSLHKDGKEILNDILTKGNGHLTSAETNNQKPETFTMEKIVRPVLTEFLEYKSQFRSEYQVKKSSGKYRYPDIKIKEDDLEILIEGEALGTNLDKEGHGNKQVEEWIGQITVKENIGIASNGAEWSLIYRDLKNSKLRDIKKLNLSKSLLILYKQHEGLKSESPVEDEGIILSELSELYSFFSKSMILSKIEENIKYVELSHEEVTKKFYIEFVELVYGHNAIKSLSSTIKSGDFLTNRITKPSGIGKGDEDKFAILFMNRLFFIKFLEEKKLVEENLLNRLKEQYQNGEYIASFYKTFLSPLFYDVFNKPSEDRGSQPDRFKKIPYLNGGLFRENVTNEQKYDINDNEIVFQIISFLEQYELKIDTKSKTRENELDPDIIGYIYEKVINTVTHGKKKDQGAYYTPEAVTFKIARDTIFPYLLSKFKEILGGEFTWTKGELDGYNDIETFLDLKDPFTSNNKIWHRFLEVLDEVKILDPSCGSGHFLITCLDILSSIKTTIYKQMGRTSNIFEIKYGIITSNLFGIDIDPIAVELAKLRLWLSLISSMNHRSTIQGSKLPNIEFNIIRGDFLLGLQTLSKLREIISHDPEELNNTLNEIKQLTRIYRNEKNPDEAAKMRDELVKNIQSLKDKANVSFQSGAEQGIDIDDLVHFPIVFPEVFTKENNGFDIIIGNPPYGNIMSAGVKSLISNYSHSKEEIAGAFIDRIIPLMSNGGSIGLIITFAITFSKDLSETRGNLLKNFERTTIVTFDRDNCRIFSEMTQSVSFLFSRNKKSGELGVIETSEFLREIPDNYTTLYHPIEGLSLFDKTPTSRLELSGKHRIPKIGDDMKYKILKFLRSFERNIGDFVDKHNGKRMWYRNSGNFWYNSWNFFPYTSSNIKEIKIKGQYQNLFLLIINSNLFYLYLRIYGDGRHMNEDIMNSFPIPEENNINKHQEEINCASFQLMNALKKNFDKERNRFHSSKVKPQIDACDDVLAVLYGLDAEQLEYIKNYDKIIRGTGMDDSD